MKLAVTTLYYKEGNVNIKKFAILSSGDCKEPRTITEDEYGAYIMGVIRHSDYVRSRTIYYDFGDDVKISFNTEATDVFKMDGMCGQSEYIATLSQVDESYVWVSIHMPEILFRVRVERRTTPNGTYNRPDIVTQTIYIEGAPHFRKCMVDEGEENKCTAFGAIAAARKIADASTVRDAFSEAVDAISTYYIDAKEYTNICDIAEIMEYAMDGDSDA